MNKKILFSYLILACIAILIHSCYYDKAELLYPSNLKTSCDTSAVISYSGRVVPILKSQCYGCHTATGGSGNINMANYTNDKALGLNGKLYGSISHAAGYSAMPKNGVTMSVCDQAVIKKWITNGCLNN